MSQNLAFTNGLIFAEAASAALGQKIPRAQARQLMAQGERDAADRMEGAIAAVIARIAASAISSATGPARAPSMAASASTPRWG